MRTASVPISIRQTAINRATVAGRDHNCEYSYISPSVLFSKHSFVLDTMIALLLIVAVSLARVNPESLSNSVTNEWTETLLDGVLSVNSMSSLMIIASKRDFPLSSLFNYTWIQQPNSLRHTVVQVANEMFKVFVGAHTGLDRIQLNLDQLSNGLKTALKLVSQASPTVAKVMLPRIASSIERSANESVTIARLVLGEFKALTNLLAEVGEASAAVVTDGSFNFAEQLQKVTAEWNQIIGFLSLLFFETDSLQNVSVVL